MSTSAISYVFAIILSFYGTTCHPVQINIGNDDSQPLYIREVGFTACHTLNARYAANETVIYNKVITNAGNGYDVWSGKFEAPVRGLYTFSFTGMAYHSTTLYLQLIKNDIYIVEIYSNDSDSATNTANLLLRPGDKVWIRVGYNPGHLQTSDYNCFSGLLVR